MTGVLTREEIRTQTYTEKGYVKTQGEADHQSRRETSETLQILDLRFPASRIVRKSISIRIT